MDFVYTLVNAIKSFLDIDEGFVGSIWDYDSYRYIVVTEIEMEGSYIVLSKFEYQLEHQNLFYYVTKELDLDDLDDIMNDISQFCFAYNGGICLIHDEIVPIQ